MASDPAFDPDALRARYRFERDKRLRPDGNDQYIHIEGTLAHYLDDPAVGERDDRRPVDDEVDALIVGGGFSGLLAGVRLRQAGIERIRIVEGGADVGGTWYWNDYPGVQCDIESYIYLPLLEEIGYMPKEKYSFGPEIVEHARAIARRWDLCRDALFQTRVTALAWSDAEVSWMVSTDRDDRFRARFVIMAIGPLSRPKLPGIPGIETFAGHSFHTSRWDYRYTGGDTNGNLVNLADKRVGVIGTGATAIQCVPHLGRWAQHLYVFQRTPSSVDERGNRPTDPLWAASLESGWQQQRIDNFGIIVTGGRAEQDLVADGWTDILRNLSGLANSRSPLTPLEIAAQVELADFAKMEQIRARIEAEVEDRATAEALKPWYRQFCKRPCFHDDYLPTFNRPSVTLVDTDGKGVDRITAAGVVAAGVEYPLDCLIFATGFEVGTDFSQRAGCDITGRRGITLAAKWGHRVATYHGLISRGFPNCFFMGGIQSGVSPNFTELYNEQSTHLGYVIGEAVARGVTVIEPTQEAEDGWLATLAGTSVGPSAFGRDCTPGYYNNEGRPDEGPGWFGGNYGGGAQAFFGLLRAWRHAGDLAGLELR